MSDDPTPLSLPTTLPFPITISRLHAKQGATVARGTPLLTYTFTSATATRELARLARGLSLSEGVRREDVREGDMSATWESGIEGDFVRWGEGVEVGRVIERRHASRPVVWLQQACTHPVQLHGLCGICGADLTSDDYLSIPPEPQAGPSRHGGFEMSHDALGVTVSSNEAKRLDNLTRDTLLRSRKLSLIVDLDQTIIHTTVDPTVGEWMAEVDEDEGSESLPSPQKHDTGIEETTTPPGTPPRPVKRKREANPNAAALRDVARFHLADDPPPMGMRQKGKLPERWYYTKPRPGLQHFLDTMSEFYEMHVYTMGTRTYADAICRVIDPEGKIFGDRILSRDESGNFTSKNLKRLFPTDQSMVVVIDDRQDVWGDCPNLVKVVPYDFFVGIGDINSSFLPPTPLSPPTTPPGSSEASTPPPVTPPQPAEEGTSEEDGLLLQKKLLDEVSEARPLAKLQEEMEEETQPVLGERSESAGNGATSPEETSGSAGNEASGDAANHESGQAEIHRHRKPILNDNDHELERLSRILRQIHTSFYDSFDDRGHSNLTPLPLGCDVELIVPDMKSQVLQGCALIFSGLIPRLQPPESTAIWQAAETFGAIPSMSLTPNITHCVAATLGTEKTYRASKLGVPVVWQGWFWESINLWERQDETPWLAMDQQQTKETSSGQPTPGPSAPATPVVEDVPLDSQAEPDGHEAATGGDDGEDFGGDDHFGEGWDDDAQAEFDAFLEGSSDFGSDAGTSVRSREGTPGTPSKKRVRYADEEHLPLESFKDPSPHQIHSPPSKKSKPLLLHAPEPNDEIPDSNRFTYKAPGTYKGDGISAGDITQDTQDHASADDGIADDDDENDDFAKMLQDELAE